MKRVGIYVRVSKEMQSAEMQSAELTQFAEARGWKIVEVFEDHGFSGKNTARPGFKRMMDAANKRRIDLCLCWKLDRFARSLPDLVNGIQQLADVGVDFVSFRDSLDLSTSQGRLMLHLLGAFAQFERDLIVSRVKAGLEHAKRKGIRIGRPQVRNDEKIQRLRAQGLTKVAIAEKLGISEGSVRRSLKIVKTHPHSRPENVVVPAGQKVGNRIETN